MLLVTHRTAPRGAALMTIPCAAERSRSVNTVAAAVNAAHTASARAGPCTANITAARPEPASVLTLSQPPSHTFATTNSRAERTIEGSTTAPAGPSKVNAPDATAQPPTTSGDGPSAAAATEASVRPAACSV